MGLFESNIELFEKDYTGTEAAEITAETERRDFYFTVIHYEGSDQVKIYDMKKNVRYTVEGTFIGVCTLLGLSLDPRELDPISSQNGTIKLMGVGVIGGYFVTVDNGKWVDYDFEDSDSQALVESELKNLWEDYKQDPERLTVYGGN